MKKYTVHMVGNHDNYQTFTVFAHTEGEAIQKGFNLASQIGDDSYSFHSIYPE